MAFVYFRSWLSGFDPPSFRYAIRLAKLHDRAHRSATEFGKALSTAGLLKTRYPTAGFAHSSLSSTLVSVSGEFTRLKLPASQGLTPFRDSFAQLIRHYETLASGEWSRLAKSMIEVKPMTEDEAITALDAASGLLAGIMRWDEDFKTSSHTFLNLNKRI